jgi:L-rhamnose mutarotase
MQEFAYTVNLKDDPQVIARYEQMHQAVWPEVVTSLKQVGVRRVRIFRLGRRLFLLMETDDTYDPATASAIHRSHAGRVQEWETLMDSLQEPVPEAHGARTWAAMQKICDF